MNKLAFPLGLLAGVALTYGLLQLTGAGLYSTAPSTAALSRGAETKGAALSAEILASSPDATALSLPLLTTTAPSRAGIKVAAKEQREVMSDPDFRPIEEELREEEIIAQIDADMEEHMRIAASYPPPRFTRLSEEEVLRSMEEAMAEAAAFAEFLAEEDSFEIDRPELPHGAQGDAFD